MSLKSWNKRSAHGRVKQKTNIDINAHKVPWKKVLHSQSFTHWMSASLHGAHTVRALCFMVFEAPINGEFNIFFGHIEDVKWREGLWELND